MKSKSNNLKLNLIQLKTFRTRFFNSCNRILHEFGSFTNLHGVKNISEDFRGLNKLSSRSQLPYGYKF